MFADKSGAKDFEFFLTQGNFLKVVDTLEKYQQRVVNTKSESGKEFIQFKRQLYQMYEVQNRSIDEHEHFSSKLERQNLRWLYQANMDYIGEMSRVSHLDNLVDHGALKGSIFRAKTLSAKRMRGLGAFAFGGFAYANLSTLALMMGPTLPTFAIVCASLYGARSFADQSMISRIDYVMEGEFAGQLRATVQKSPFVSYTIVMSPANTMSVCAVGADDLGEEDAEGNVLSVSEYVVESTGKKEKGGIFTLPADAYRDKTTLEWIFAKKVDGGSTTDDLFNHCVMQRHIAYAKTGGITGLRRHFVEQTGFAEMGDEEEINI